MSRYAIAWPGDAVKSILSCDQDAVFLDDHGWWVYSAATQSRSLTRLKFDPSVISEDVSVASIREHLNWWSPIFTRWFGVAEDYELLRSQSIFTILKIVCGMKLLDINIVLMHTGVPHHWDSLVVSIACQTIKAKQVFLYAQVFDVRLLPLVQCGNIGARSVLICNLSGKDYGDEIDQFIDNKRSGKPPKANQKSAFYKANYFFACISLIYYIRPSIRKLLGKMTSPSVKYSGWILQGNYSLLSHFNIINNQRKFLSSYKIYQISNSQINMYLVSQEPRLVIAAHYQPEATSFPEGGDYFNHVDIALALRIKGYLGDLLYKEHPASWWYIDNIIGPTRVGLYRSDRYVEDLLEIGCLLLPKRINLSVMANECKWYVPVTITGTIAIERSLVGLRTIVTGEPWFKGMPGLINLSEITSLNVIDPSWTVPDSAIADNAKTFLLSLLSNNTLINYPGIGTGRTGNDPEQYQLFASQLLNLINQMNK